MTAHSFLFGMSDKFHSVASTATCNEQPAARPVYAGNCHEAALRTDGGCKAASPSMFRLVHRRCCAHNLLHLAEMTGSRIGMCRKRSSGDNCNASGFKAGLAGSCSPRTLGGLLQVLQRFPVVLHWPPLRAQRHRPVSSVCMCNAVRCCASFMQTLAMTSTLLPDYSTQCRYAAAAAEEQMPRDGQSVLETVAGGQAKT